MKVAVLGCGPAGLLAAEAIVQAGHTPIILSHKVKSEMFGAMYLHEAIPQLTDASPDYEIMIIKVGTRAGYAKLVYGDPDHSVSWDKFTDGSTPGWNLKAAYDELWNRFQGDIREVDLDPIETVAAIQENYPVVISTVPRKAMCFSPEHVFEEQEIWIQHGPGQDLIEGVNDDDMMYYNGYPPDGSVQGMIGPDWYRFSQLDRYQAWEYSRKPSSSTMPDWQTLSHGGKPTRTNCSCWPEFYRVGRFGCWDKHQLTHHAYFLTKKLLEGGRGAVL